MASTFIQRTTGDFIKLLMYFLVCGKCLPPIFQTISTLRPLPPFWNYKHLDPLVASLDLYSVCICKYILLGGSPRQVLTHALLFHSKGLLFFPDMILPWSPFEKRWNKSIFSFSSLSSSMFPCPNWSSSRKSRSALFVSLRRSSVESTLFSLETARFYPSPATRHVLLTNRRGHALGIVIISCPLLDL